VAHQIFVTVTGRRQGVFDEDATSAPQPGKIPVLTFTYGVQTPRDPGTGQPTGKRRHQPVMITVEGGPSSVQFYQAIYTNEALPSVLFEFVNEGADGKPGLDHSVKLTNAAIDSIGQSAHAENTEPREIQTIAFSFQSIEIIDGGASARDNTSFG